ncbi:DUF389 domain-containing protein [Prescottella defluvii]|nr:DUF389 domain-containing protein [Prescottella defluvii]
MIVAPLSTPILGIGLGITTGRASLLGRSLLVALLGTVLVVAMGALFVQVPNHAACCPTRRSSAARRRRLHRGCRGCALRQTLANLHRVGGRAGRRGDSDGRQHSVVGVGEADRRGESAVARGCSRRRGERISPWSTGTSPRPPSS